MKRYTWFLVIAAILVGGVLVYNIHKTNKTTSSSSTANTSSNGLVAVGSTAPLFNVPTISGQQFSLAAYKGKTVVMFGMFGSCSECIPEGQALDQIQKNNGATVAVIGLDVLNGEPASELEAYEQEAGIAIPLALYDQDVINSYKLTQPEITYIINKEGKVAYASPSFVGEANLQQQVTKATND